MSIPSDIVVSHRRSSELRQQEIVAAVLALVLETGVESVTTQRIADRLGLTQGAIFRHFPSKEAIWVAVLDWLKVRLGGLFERRTGNPPLAELARIFDGYMTIIADFPAMPRLIFADTFHHGHPALHAEVQTLVTGCLDRLAELVAEARSAGQVDARIDPTTAARMLLSMIQGLAFQSAIVGILPDPRLQGLELFVLWRTAITCEMPLHA